MTTSKIVGRSTIPSTRPTISPARSSFAPAVLLVLLCLPIPSFASQLVLNTSGGTASLGSNFSLSGATVASPAGSLSFDCPITQVLSGTYQITYVCSGGSFTYQSSDSSTTVAASFTSGDVYLTASGGGRGGNIHYYYQFVADFTGIQTTNGVSAAINGETSLSLGPLTSEIGSTAAGASATGINWDYSPLYIADYSFSRIIRVDDLFGTNQLSFGSTGTGVNQFYGTSGIALDSSGRIYIGDLYNARIVRIDDMTGKNWTTFGTYGSGAKQFSYATGDIAIDSQGRIYVMDIGNGRIDRFDDMNGTNWTTFGTPGTGVNQFEGASGIALDSAGNIYIADQGNGRIVQMADMNGTNWTTLSPVGAVTHVAIDPQNRILWGVGAGTTTLSRVDDMTGANRTNLALGSAAVAVNAIQVDSYGTTFVATQYGGEMLFDDIATGAGLLSTNLISQPSGIAVVPVPNPVPAVKLSGTSLTFAAQNTGTVSVPQSITLTNFGSAPLTPAITVSQDFQVSTTCPSALDGGSNCTISVSYAPSVTGPETGALIITDNAFTGTQTVTLSGTGTAPVAGILPSGIQFQPQLVTTTSGGQIAVLTNTGSGALTFSGSGISTTGDFAQTNNCGSALPPLTSCQMLVTFTPSATGARTGSLLVNGNAATQTVSLAGIGAAAAPTVIAAPESLVFPTQLVKVKSAAQPVVLTNTGAKAIPISSIALTGDFALTGKCPLKLAAGKSCTLNITFTPTASGLRTGTLTYNLATGTVTVALTGTGTATATGWLTISPNPVVFSNYQVGDNPSQTVTVTNTNGVPAGITKISKSGSGTFTQTNNCGGILSAYASCSITVTFMPKVAGSFTGTLTLTEGAGEVHTIPLSGLATTNGG